MQTKRKRPCIYNPIPIGMRTKTNKSTDSALDCALTLFATFVWRLWPCVLHILLWIVCWFLYFHLHTHFLHIKFSLKVLLWLSIYLCFRLCDLFYRLFVGHKWNAFTNSQISLMHCWNKCFECGETKLTFQSIVDVLQAKKVQYSVFNWNIYRKNLGQRDEWRHAFAKSENGKKTWKKTSSKCIEHSMWIRNGNG